MLNRRFLLTLVLGVLSNGIISSSFAQSSPSAPATTFDCKIGAPPLWIRGCSAELTTGRHGSGRTCTSSPPPGFVLLQAQAVPTSVNNGDVSLSTLPSQSTLTWSEAIEKAYSDIIEDVAEGQYIDSQGKPVKASAKLKMQEDLKARSNEATKYESSHQVALLRVNTNGRGKFDNRRSWAKGYSAMYVQCVAPGNLVDQLAIKYQLKLKPAPKKKAKA